MLETNGMNHRSYPVHGVVHALQRLKPLGHQEIRELFVNGLHFLRDLQYPLFVGIRRVVVGRGARRNEKKNLWFTGSPCSSTTLQKSLLAD